MFLEQVLMVIVGITLIAAGGVIAKHSLDARNVIESALFGIMSITVGTFLITWAFTGPPNW